MRVKKREIDWVGEIKECLVRERDVKSEKERERGNRERERHGGDEESGRRYRG